MKDAKMKSKLNTRPLFWEPIGVNCFQNSVFKAEEDGLIQ